MKEKVLKDIGDEVVITDIYDNSKEVIGIVSMITITRKGIKYRAKFGYDYQRDFWQEEIIR